jgi:hypothetical protein
MLWAILGSAFASFKALWLKATENSRVAIWSLPPISRWTDHQGPMPGGI